MKMNFRNDPLVQKSSKKGQFIFRKTLNLYSCLVKTEDFHPKNKILNKIAYVGGKILSKKIKNTLKELPIELKKENFLELKKLFLKYCGIKPNYQNIWRTGRLFKKCFKKRLFPIIILRIITLNNKKKFIELIEKIEFATSFSNSVQISLPNTLKKFKNNKLWYFVGVIFGDGYLLKSRKDYRILVADGSSNQEELKDSFNYIKKLAFLFNELFNIKKNKIKIENRGNWYVVFVSSKWLMRFLNFFFDMPIGKKKGKLSTPKILDIMDDKYEKVFWRGMFDTDGMINPTARNAEIASSDYLLMKKCSIFLFKLKVPTEIKEGKDGKKGHKYYRINIKSNYFKKFAFEIGSSHPRKQKVLINHLKYDLKYYILQGINKRYLTKKGEFKLHLLKNKNSKKTLPKKLSKKLIEIASYIKPTDWEKKRIYFGTKYTKEERLKEALKKFEILFKSKPKFLKTRNLYYVNSKLLYKFFNKFFIYKSPWKPISENSSKNLLIKWNRIFE